MKYMYLGQLLQGDVQLVLHVLHLLLKIADLENIAKFVKYSSNPHVGQILVRYQSNIPQQSTYRLFCLLGQTGGSPELSVQLIGPGNDGNVGNGGNYGNDANDGSALAMAHLMFDIFQYIFKCLP